VTRPAGRPAGPAGAELPPTASLPARRRRAAGPALRIARSSPRNGAARLRREPEPSEAGRALFEPSLARARARAIQWSPRPAPEVPGPLRPVPGGSPWGSDGRTAPRGGPAGVDGLRASRYGRRIQSPRLAFSPGHRTGHAVRPGRAPWRCSLWNTVPSHTLAPRPRLAAGATGPQWPRPCPRAPRPRPPLSPNPEARGHAEPSAPVGTRPTSITSWRDAYRTHRGRGASTHSLALAAP
jgi:hypothetical protein